MPIGSSPADGPADAWVTLVEFTDFQCPDCRTMQPVIEAVLAQPGCAGDVRRVVKHFPLQRHAWGKSAAVAAQCAHEQGKFWEVHTLLFERQWQSSLPGSPDLRLQSLVSQVPGLDLAQWKERMGQPGPAEAVEADLALVQAIRDSGVPAFGTPTLVVNGQLLFERVGHPTVDQLQRIVDQARAAAIASGVPRDRFYERVVLGL